MVEIRDILQLIKQRKVSSKMKKNCYNCKHCLRRFCYKQGGAYIYQFDIECKLFEPNFLCRFFGIDFSPKIPKTLTQNCQKPPRPKLKGAK